VTNSSAMSSRAGTEQIIMLRVLHLLARSIAVVVLAAVPTIAQSPPAQDPAAEWLRQGQQKLRDGQADEAVSIYRQALQASPRSFPVNNQLGVALDLTGQYAEARTYFTKALDVA